MSATYSPESQPWFEPLRKHLDVPSNDETFAALLLLIQRSLGKKQFTNLTFINHTSNFVEMAQRAQGFFRANPQLGVR